MEDDTRTPSIYRLVIEVFKDLGVSDVDSVSHSILLHSRSFAGEKFECEGIRAILPLDGKRLVFFGRNGEILERVDVAKRTSQTTGRRYGSTRRSANSVQALCKTAAGENRAPSPVPSTGRAA